MSDPDGHCSHFFHLWVQLYRCIIIIIFTIAVATKKHKKTIITLQIIVKIRNHLQSPLTAAKLDEQNLTSQNSHQVHNYPALLNINCAFTIVLVGWEEWLSSQAPKRGAVVKKESDVIVKTETETSPSWPSSLPSSWPSSLPARRAAPQPARPPLPPPRAAPLPPPRARPPPPSPPTRRGAPAPATLQTLHNKELHPTYQPGAGGAGGGAGGGQTPARQFSYSSTSRKSRPPPPQVIFDLFYLTQTSTASIIVIFFLINMLWSMFH